MTETERHALLAEAKDFFRNRIAANHIKNSEKLGDISKFNVNPFTHKYLAQFAFGDSSPESMAKALLYPRILGTSISTTFGTQLQYFCNEVLASFASVVSGIDIEFVDTTDGRRKYCQVKAGPNTINKDDIKTIVDHFSGIRNLARTNHLDVRTTDCIVGVFYGTAEELSSSYKKIDENYPVYVGADFWHRLTGEPRFYYDLIDAFAELCTKGVHVLCRFVTDFAVLAVRQIASFTGVDSATPQILQDVHIIPPSTLCGLFSPQSVSSYQQDTEKRRLLTCFVKSR